MTIVNTFLLVLQYNSSACILKLFVALDTKESIPLSRQGMMFGYATDETEELMPLSIMLAHKLNRRMADLRRSGELPWARPDSKSQVKSGMAAIK